MKQSLFLLMVIALAAGAAASGATTESRSSELQKLEVSAGHWIYHGETLNTPFGKAGPWTWNEDCRWSENREFMVCSFTNDWAGRIAKSLVVDTWDGKDKSFWHYELFGSSAMQPFVSRMTINGNTRVEYATSSEAGKKYQTRITYVFDSPTRVNVKIEISRHGALWVKVDQGEGLKQP